MKMIIKKNGRKEKITIINTADKWQDKLQKWVYSQAHPYKSCDCDSHCKKKKNQKLILIFAAAETI